MRVALFITFAFAVLLDPVPALGTVYLPADFGEMVDGSLYIVHGRVADVRSAPTVDRRRVVTHVTLEVAQPLKGSPGDSITFMVPGGQVGAYERVVVGAPRFEAGDEVILFLTARGPSIPYVFGLSQGVYRVSRASGRPLVAPPAVFVDAAEGAEPGRLVRGDPARRALPLDDFARAVRATMERGK